MPLDHYHEPRTHCGPLTDCLLYWQAERLWGLCLIGAILSLRIHSFIQALPAASSLKKVGCKKLQISNKGYGHMGARNFNFAHKFLHNGGIPNPKFCIFGRKFFRQEENVPRVWNLGGGAVVPCHDTTELQSILVACLLYYTAGLTGCVTVLSTYVI